MPIDPAVLRRIARLAHLEPDDDLDGLTRDLQSILDHVALLDELDVEGVEPTATVAAAAGSGARDDEPRPGLSNEQALANAPDVGHGHFRVPRVLEE